MTAALVGHAADLACRARDEDAAGLHAELRRLDRDRLAGLTLTLALMVDVEHARLPVYTGSHHPAVRPAQRALYVRHCRRRACGRLFLAASGHRWYCTRACNEQVRRQQWRESKQRARDSDQGDGASTATASRSCSSACPGRT